jgi:hypothetical protein
MDEYVAKPVTLDTLAACLTPRFVSEAVIIQQ